MGSNYGPGEQGEGSCPLCTLRRRRDLGLLAQSSFLSFLGIKMFQQ